MRVVPAVDRTSQRVAAALVAVAIILATLPVLSGQTIRGARARGVVVKSEEGGAAIGRRGAVVKGDEGYAVVDGERSSAGCRTGTTTTSSTRASSLAATSRIRWWDRQRGRSSRRCQLVRGRARRRHRLPTLRRRVLRAGHDRLSGGGALRQSLVLGLGERTKNQERRTKAPRPYPCGGRTMQRNPTWQVEVSTGSGNRAAGR
jgi:hypothetical protein